MNPKIFPSKFRAKGTFLALGAELKNEFAIYKDGQIFISPYIGDLKNVATNERFFALLDMFVRAYELKFDAVSADLHPQFSHTRFFERRGYPVIRYQHHFAHLVSNLAQNELLFRGKKYLGFCFDGTGYGTDGTIWGGEVMVFDPRGYRRVAKFDEIVLLGGENAIKNIYKLALALVFKFNAKDAAREFLAKFSSSEVANLEKIAPRAVRSSSLGRLFDAFAAVICDLRAVSFDGEAGMRLVQALRWPALLEPWLAPERRHKTMPPPWDPRCSEAESGQALVISGLHDGTVLRRAGDGAAPLVELRARGASGEVFWLLDGKLAAQTEADAAWLLRFTETGPHVLTAVSGQGAFQRISVVVQ